MFKPFYKLFVPLLLISLALPGCSRHKRIVTNVDINQRELTFSATETRAISKWQNKSMDDLADEATKGDPAALWMFSLCFLTGQGGWFVDTEVANFYMARSAALGFAPALDNIRRMYLELKNPFLFAVYTNLVIAVGHSELINAYHDFLSECPTIMVQTIEKVALHKYAKILENIKTQKKDPDFCATIPITDEDILFNNEYWANALNGVVPQNIDEWACQSQNLAQIAEYSKSNNEYMLSQLVAFDNATKEA